LPPSRGVADVDGVLADSPVDSILATEIPNSIDFGGTAEVDPNPVRKTRRSIVVGPQLDRLRSTVFCSSRPDRGAIT